jgi:cyclopropane fatty-acyl-phospholipid synthase-like methyltransferase
MDKPFSAACERNKAPILQVLRPLYAGIGRVLEIGSGTGQHALHFAAAMPQLQWQCSDLAANLPGLRSWLEEAALPNLPPPLALDVKQGLPSGPFDAVFTANTLHIMGWGEVQQLFAGLATLLPPGGLFTAYGPFNIDGRFTSEGNARFDAELRQADPRRGIRDLAAVDALARAAGLQLLADEPMPAHNRCVSWKRGTLR